MLMDCAEDPQSRQRMLMRARHNNVRDDIDAWASAALRRHQVVCYGRIVTKFAAAAIAIQLGAMAIERTVSLFNPTAAVQTGASLR